MRGWGASVAVVCTATLLAGCSAAVTHPGAAAAPTVTITDMSGREVAVPEAIHRVLALHPIPTTLLELLAPGQIVGVDSVLSRSLQPDDARFSPQQMSSLRSLPVTGVYFRDFDSERVMRLHPDVVITMTGDRNVDREQQRTGIPFITVSKTPTSNYEKTIRLIGQIVGQSERADQMAAFWAQTIAAVQARTAAVPASGRPLVMYTGKNGDLLGIPGKDTVFGSSITTAGGRYVGDTLPARQSATENNPVTLEQVMSWNPAVIIAASARARTAIVNDPRWRTVKAVHDGRVYVPPRYASLDGLQAVLGMVWTQGVVLGDDDASARSTLTNAMQRYYQLFYGHPLTAAQLDQLPD